MWACVQFAVFCFAISIHFTSHDEMSVRKSAFGRIDLCQSCDKNICHNFKLMIWHLSFSAIRHTSHAHNIHRQNFISHTFWFHLSAHNNHNIMIIIVMRMKWLKFSSFSYTRQFRQWKAEISTGKHDFNNDIVSHGVQKNRRFFRHEIGPTLIQNW